MLALKVAEDVKLDGLNAGDTIAVTFTQGLALDMVAQAPAKKKAK